MDSEQSLPSALGHPGGLACQVPGRAWLRPPRTRTGRLALTSGRVACQRHPIPRHEIGSENRCRWTLRMCMASHIYEYTQQTTHRVATNTTRRPLFHRAPEDEDDRGAHSKAKEFILGISVCCLCFLKLVNLDLDLFSWPHTHPIRGATLNLFQKTWVLGSGNWVRPRSAKWRGGWW